MSSTYDYDDYYDNYNEFDAQIEKFKQSLIKSVKEEHQKEIAKLREENAKLQEVKRNWNTLENELKTKIRELETQKKQNINIVRSDFYDDKLKDFLEKAFEARTLYQVNDKEVKSKKCDLCDSNRNIILKDDSGREYKVKCKCTITKTKYIAEKANLNLYIQKSERDNNFWMALRKEDSDFSSTNIFGFGDAEIKTKGIILDKFDIDNLPKSIYYTYFTNKGEAQKYADYLNEKSQEEEYDIIPII
ncbi:MAG: hypothetical protein M0Q88_00275 [Bacilli bacterium]|nr:hypothetical protein [Bacilli bacterium]